MTDIYSDEQKKKILFIYEKAKQGDTDAQFSLGLILATGEEIEKNEESAVRWYFRAAQQGHRSAQNNLGVMFKTGKGITKSEAEAAKWFQKAADQGDAIAQFNFGIMLQHGQGIKKDKPKAFALFQKAAEQGYVAAENHLGLMLKDGIGIARDTVSAVKWFRKAAEEGHAEAQFNLAKMLETGEGTIRSEAEARSWFQTAAGQGYKPSRKYPRGLLMFLLITIINIFTLTLISTSAWESNGDQWAILFLSNVLVLSIFCINNFIKGLEVNYKSGPIVIFVGFVLFIAILIPNVVELVYYFSTEHSFRFDSLIDEISHKLRDRSSPKMLILSTIIINTGYLLSYSVHLIQRILKISS